MIIACPECHSTDHVEVVHGSVYGHWLNGYIPDGEWCPTGFLMCTNCLGNREGFFIEPPPYVCDDSPIKRGDLPERWWDIEPWKSLTERD